MRGAGRRVARTVAVFLPLAVVIGIAGGPIVVVVPVLAGLGYWRPRWLPWVAFVAMLLTGVVSATGLPSTIGSGAFSGLAQAGALLALTAALIPDIARKVSRPAGQPQDVP
jgi:arabinofuranan 3-O-arabinosyltransferase